jgi:predicted nucleic acid-binding protein
MHKLARSYLDKVRDKHAEMYIPAVALIETAIVISRITNNEDDSRKAVSFLRRNAAHVFYEHEILEEAISFGIEAKGEKGHLSIYGSSIQSMAEKKIYTDRFVGYKFVGRK